MAQYKGLQLLEEEKLKYTCAASSLHMILHHHDAVLLKDISVSMEEFERHH